MTPAEVERERPFLFGLAYRILGSAADADDVLQEAYLRVADVTPTESPRALLATVVTRLCLDEVRSARRRREEYVGPWLPEPAPDLAPADDPLDRAESVSMAFLVLLESLSPLERAVFVLREVFDFDFADVARATGRSEAACRQCLHRAKEHLAARPQRRPAPPELRDGLTASFLGAVATGDLDALVAMLTDDVTAVADHGGKASAARRAVRGAGEVARFLVGLTRKAMREPGVRSEVAHLNGAPAVVVWEAGRVTSALLADVVDGDGGPRVGAVFVVRNPDKLARLTERLKAG